MAVVEKEHKGIGATEVVAGAGAGIVAGGIGRAAFRMKNILDSGIMSNVQEQIAANTMPFKEGMELLDKTATLKGSQPLIVTATAIAAAVLVGFGINAYRNRDKPDNHIDPKTVEMAAERASQKPLTQGQDGVYRR